MKKLVVAVASSLLLAVGLVGTPGSTALARDCPYTGCLNTTTHVDGPRAVPRHAKARMKVRVRSGNAVPRGAIKLVVKRNNGGFRHERMVPYRGGSVIIRTPKLDRKGRYTVVAVYKPGPRQPFKSSRDSSTLWVRSR